MKFKLLKTAISKLYSEIRGIHIEVVTNELYNSLNRLGKNSWIDYPFEVSNPQKVSIGSNTTILSNSRLDCYSGENIIGELNIGDNCYISYYFSALVGGDISIGDGVLIASGVTVCSHNHGIDPNTDVLYMHQPLERKKVSIGDGTWIGQNVTVLMGVNIGKKCVIGSNAVVTKDVPDYSIAVGNPARVVKRFDFNKNRWERI